MSIWKYKFLKLLSNKYNISLDSTVVKEFSQSHLYERIVSTITLKHCASDTPLQCSTEYRMVVTLYDRQLNE